MPSGPKKRRAAKKKNDTADTGFTNPTREEEKLVDDVKLSENLSNASVMNGDDVNAEISTLETPVIVNLENVERSDDVPDLESVVTKGKESENQSFHDEFSVNVPILDPVINQGKLSESGANMGQKSADLGLPQVLLIEPGSKDIKGNGSAEGSESALHGPLAMVSEVVSVVKNMDQTMNNDSVIEDPFQEATLLILKCIHAMSLAIDKSGLKELPSKEAQDPPLSTDYSTSELNVDTSLKDGEDSPKDPFGSSLLDDVSASEGVDEGKYACLKKLAKKLMELVDEETRLKASYDDWHSRFQHLSSQLTIYLVFLDYKKKI